MGFSGFSHSCLIGSLFFSSIYLNGSLFSEDCCFVVVVRDIWCG